MKTIEAKKRDLGTNLDMVRSLGMIPAIVYAKGIENIPVSVPENLVRSLWKDIKEKQPFTLDIEGTQHTVSMQDIQVHVVSGDILHMDFMVHTG
jgi:ribosomal protein L25 (general stress protein Ctc)